jgi:hypothetical protein
MKLGIKLRKIRRPVFLYINLTILSTKQKCLEADLCPLLGYL